MSRSHYSLIFPWELRRRSQSLPLEAQVPVKKGIRLYTRYLTAISPTFVFSLICFFGTEELQEYGINPLLNVMFIGINLIPKLWNQKMSRTDALKELYKLEGNHFREFQIMLAIQLAFVIPIYVILIGNTPENLSTGLQIALNISLYNIAGRILDPLIAALKDEPGLPRKARQRLKTGQKVSA